MSTVWKINVDFKAMSRSKLFCLLIICFILGVFCASLFSIPNLWVYWALTPLVMGLGGFYFFGEKFSAGLFLCLTIFCLGVFRLNTSFKANEFADLFGKKQKIEGLVVEDPDLRLDKQLLTVRPKNYTQNILVTVNLSQEFFYGDEVAIEGKIEEAKNFSDFDYKGYLEMKNIYALSNRPKVLILHSHRLNFFKEKVLRIKHAFVERVSNMLAEPEKSLLLGILIGAKKTLPSDITEAFNRAGLSHLIAVSGFNISIIVGALSYAAWVIGRRYSFWLSIFFIIAFTILTGASASVLRASLMGFLLLLALRHGRLYAITPSLLFTAGVMVLINPKILVWDVGFQLSFLATAGIVYGVPVLQKLTERWVELKFLKDIFVTTLCAIVATLPLLLFKFGQLSVIAILANLIILPFIPLVMAIGFLSVLPFLGSGFAFVASLLLKAVIWIVIFLTSWKYASLAITISPLTFVVLCGAVLVCFFWLKQFTGKVETKTEV
jgi:competence protein ComEC